MPGEARATIMRNWAIHCLSLILVLPCVGAETLPENMILYCSSEPGQTALSQPESKHGLFTYYLMKNLKDTKGEVSYAGLGDYLSKNVSLESLKNFSTEQDPVIYTGEQAFTWWRYTRFIEH